MLKLIMIEVKQGCVWDYSGSKYLVVVRRELLNILLRKNGWGIGILREYM